MVGKSRTIVAVFVLTMLFGGTMAFGQSRPSALVIKSPFCGCCSEWVTHLEQNGFQVRIQDVQDLRGVKESYGIPGSLESCHTAVIGSYVIEGHVPAADILRLLEEAPDAAGLAVPGMPIGSPGMEVPGTPADPYDVLLFYRGGDTEVYSSYR